MKPNQVSPVVIQFKSLPGVRLVAVSDQGGNGAHDCDRCELKEGGNSYFNACMAEAEKPSGSCARGNYHYEHA